MSAYDLPRETQGVVAPRPRVLHAPVDRSTPLPGRLVPPAARATRRASRHDATYRRLLGVADAVAAIMALVIAVPLLGDDGLRLAALAGIPIAVLVSKVIGLYDRDEVVIHRSTLDEAPALFQLATLYALLVWLLQGALVTGPLGERQVLGLWGLLWFLLMSGRTLARTLASRVAEPERALLVGDAETSLRIQGRLGRGRHLNAIVVARLPLDGAASASPGDILGRLDEVAEAIARRDADRVIIAPRVADSDGVLELIRALTAMGVKVSLLPRLTEVVGSSVEFDSIEGLTLLGIRPFGLSRSSELVKRAFDLVGSIVGLAALAPLAAVLAVAIRLDSRGQVLFRQERIGRNGQPFAMVKFRTMVDGADQRKADLLAHNEAEGLFKIAEDPRMTPVGRILRRSSLDELPQLWNVLRGEMSLVGPRPLVADDDERVTGLDRQRLQLKPGMTGPWQVLGAARVPLRDMVAIDYLYAANWSLWTDVKVLLRTVPHVLARRGL